MRRSLQFMLTGAMVVSAATFSGCTSGPEPQTAAKRETLSIDADAALRRMSATDPGLRDFLDRSYGYAIFPAIGKGAFVVGGAYGRGEVYRGGAQVGFADVTAISAGLSAGGQTISELLVFSTEKAFNDFTRGEWGMGANASVVALKAGAAAGAQFRDGVVTFVDTRGGLMGDLSLEGQRFRYQARAGGESSRTAAYREDEARAAERRDRDRELRTEQDRERRELDQKQQEQRQELRKDQQEQQRELRDQNEIKTETKDVDDGPAIRGEIEVGPDAADKN
jgi:lipid-binding SYLF domain-containing protein